MRITEAGGILIEEEKNRISIDPTKKKSLSLHNVISHAHSDHYPKNSKEQCYLTRETHALLQNTPAKLSLTKTIPWKKKFPVGNLTAQLQPSGHILGSSQIQLEASQNILITSDFNPVDSILFPGAQPQNCDILVMETTFGLPQYAFPDRQQVHEAMGKWIQQQTQQNRVVVLAGYALGKAQELTRICNEYAGIEPIVHEKIFQHNQTYDTFGITLGKSIPLDHNLKESNVLILPPTMLEKNLVATLEFALHKKVVTAMATGWEYRNGFDKVFPLSDHADYNHLMQFVEACNPKQVYTMHGFAQEFAHAIQRKLKIPARALNGHQQQSIAEFAFE